MFMAENLMVARLDIYGPAFLSGNQMVTWIMNKKIGNEMVTTIQLMDYLKSGNWMFPVTEGPITKCLMYLIFEM